MAQVAFSTSADLSKQLLKKNDRTKDIFSTSLLLEQCHLILEQQIQNFKGELFMGQPIFSTGQLPTYHEGMLIVKMRSSASIRATSAANFEERSVLESPGISALSTFERAGLIKKVTPLARAEEERSGSGTGRIMATIASSMERVSVDRIDAGVNFIELERDRDVPDLQIALANDPNVEYVSRVAVRYLVAKAEPSSLGSGIAAVPPSVSTMWNLKKIRWQEARTLPSFKEATNISVAVLDTGIDMNHPDLQGKVSSYVFEHEDLPTASGEQDIIGHGTHVAGTIAATINNNLGINGICECQLHIWKIFDDIPDFVSCADGYAYFVEPVMYLRALADCLEQNINVINLSIGGPGRPDPQEQRLFDALLANGTTIVAAMGNERLEGNPISYPAAIRGVIAVGATNLNDSFANFSNRGNHISISAPGVGIWSTLPSYGGQFGFRAICTGGSSRLGAPNRRETNYDAWDGTSMASPHVAGAAALFLANRGIVNGSQVRSQLMKTADKVTGMRGRNFTPDYGTGRLNLLRLLSE
jgi:Subtilase family